MLHTPCIYDANYKSDIHVTCVCYTVTDKGLKLYSFVSFAQSV